eukprot:14183743-Alexandrium_andersonii.AAC.1
MKWVIEGARSRESRRNKAPRSAILQSAIRAVLCSRRAQSPVSCRDAQQVLAEQTLQPNTLR